MILHPCPHCGKTENDRDDSTGMNAVEACNYPASEIFVVQCHYCGLSGPLEETVALAITAWNSLPRKAVTADDIIADLESRGLGWSLDHTGRLIEARVWDWPTVIARYRPHAVEPLAKMLATAAFDVDWTKYPVKP
jgi:Lar family restriction alleviation protein